MKIIISSCLKRIGVILFVLLNFKSSAKQHFKVIGFYSAKEDQGHISFVHEANKWFSAMAQQNGFSYDSTNNWSNLNDSFLSKYDVALFLDTRPEVPDQRKAFERYMASGGAWMGFHFAAFALTPSGVEQNWDWYHNTFIGAGQYKGNTWRPTSAILQVMNPTPATASLPHTFKSSPNEWYSWERDLRKNDSIKILLAIDSSSFPLGTGPKLYEIWHSGFYPVAWTNKYYRMIYFNMGHNDIDYEHHTNNDLSLTFGNEIQDRLTLNSLLWLGRMGNNKQQRTNAGCRYPKRKRST